MIGIKLIGIPKYQNGTTRGGLVNLLYSGLWGNRGKGNELQSALENGLSWVEDKIVNLSDYIEDGAAYLVGLLPGGQTPKLSVLTARNKRLAKPGEPYEVEGYSTYKIKPSYGEPPITPAMNPVFDLVSPIKGGWMLKGLMKGSPLEKQLSKAGTININGLLVYLNKASKLELDVISRILSTKFAGLKNIDYNSLRKAVSDELITYSRKPLNRYSTYGMDEIGFKSKKILDGAGGIVEYVPGVKTQTFTFESPRIPIGNGKHYDNSTLGHSRTYTTPDEPDILHVMESQSDWGLSKILAPYSGTTEYLNNPQAYRRFIDGHKRLLEKMQLNPGNYVKGAIERLIANIEHHENILNLILNGPGAQNQHLHDNYLLRLLLENMKYAAEQGLKRMRYPTSETVAKIERYKKTYPEPEYSMLKLQNEAYQQLFENDVISYDRYLELTDQVNKRLREIQGLGLYSPEHQTILKKYADFPKMFNKLFKGLEVRTVTDSKGNTWYEVNIPENFLQSEWLFKWGGKLGINKVIGL